MRVAVTGGAGFIGGWVVDELITRGHEPIIFDHLGRAHRDDVTVMLGDTRDDVAVVELAAHVDGIIHLASVLGTQETVANPRPAVLTNLTSALNVFEAGCQYNLPVVNITVGNATHANPYSASKACASSLGIMYARDRGLRINQVRAVNAYGPRQVPATPYGPSKVRKIMPAFVCRALTDTPIEVYGDGRQVSDMVWVGDVARALVNALEAANGGTVFDRVADVGPEVHHTVAEVARLVNDVAGTPRRNLAHLKMRPGETPGARVVADIRTMKLLGLSPADLVPLAEGVNATVEWFEKHWLPDYLSRIA